MNARFRKKIARDVDGNKHSFSSLRHTQAQRPLAGVMKSWAAVHEMLHNADRPRDSAGGIPPVEERLARRDAADFALT